MIRRWFVRIDEAVRKVPPRRLFWGIVAINLLLITLVAASTLIPRRARITIAADTEIGSVELPAGQQSMAWGTLAVAPESIDSLPVGCTDPIIDLSAPVEGPLRVELRLAPQSGLLSIALTRPAGNVGTIICADGREFGSGKFVRILRPEDPDRSLVLRFMGQLTVGDDLPEGVSTPAILHDGTIGVEAASFPFRNGAVRAETKLYSGDRVQLFDSSDTSRPATAHGIFVIKESGLIKVIAHADAREARIIRIGQDEATAASVAPTFWAKVQAQSEWTILILLGALLLNVVGALHRYRAELLAEPATRRRK